jgi:signal transduction histidine kinase
MQRRLPEVVEVAAYYAVAESFTNAAKHAQASELTVMVNADDENLHLLVRDDGIGGADFGKGPDSSASKTAWKHSGVS